MKLNRNEQKQVFMGIIKKHLNIHVCCHVVIQVNFYLFNKKANDIENNMKKHVQTGTKTTAYEINYNDT